MSKAFTRETDEPENFPPPPRSPLPPGVKNYITPAGARRLREELAGLAAQAASGGENPLRDARIRQLQEIIPTLEVAEPPAEQTVARFGAKVTIQRRDGAESYRVVGVDETNLDENHISWLSPLGKTLLGKRAGDRVPFRSPSGAEEILVLSVEY